MSVRDWRYCGARQAKFYDGYAEKGACHGGDGHSSIGCNFALPHVTDPRAHVPTG